MNKTLTIVASDGTIYSVPDDTSAEQIKLLREKKPATIIRTDMSKEEWSKLADDKLQELLQTTSGALLLAVVKESKDRLEGRPTQRIEASVAVASFDVTEHKRQVREEALAMMNRIATTGSIVVIDNQPNNDKSKT